ncbi:MAG: glycerophosphodiester phosphodiesterase family protein [Clostridiales bacterium]|nr:glycerophosphodiester phosphodiesterase family protein [Clostridiales bacterium]
MKKVKTIITILLVFILLCVSSLNIFAGQEPKNANAFENKELVCAANKGDFSEYPECSLPAIKSAYEIGAKIVCVNLQKTKDNIFVVMEDASLERTVLNENGDFSGNVSDYTYEEISKGFLKNNDSTKSDLKVPTLEQALEAVADGCFLMIKNANEIYKQLPQTDKLIFRFENLKTKEIRNIIESYNYNENSPAFCFTYKGSIVFPALSRAKLTASTPFASIIEFTSRNVNSIVFSEFLGDKIDNIGTVTVADMTDYKKCGKRVDDSVGYDELVRAGYDVIITNHAKAMCNYIEDIEVAKKELEVTLKEAQKKYDNENCTADTKKKLLWAMEESREALALSEIHTAINNIEDAEKNLVYSDNKQNFVTPVRVALVVLVGGIFAFIDVILYKKPKKSTKIDKE